MYKKSFVCAVQIDGKTLRENDNGDVQIPFGSEYSILLKNNNSSEIAFIEIEIDGDKKTGYGGIILLSNEKKTIKSNTVDYFRINDKENPRNFRFIEKTDEISEFRGDKIDDGLIKITVRYGNKKRPFDYDHFYNQILRNNKSNTDIYQKNKRLNDKNGFNDNCPNNNTILYNSKNDNNTILFGNGTLNSINDEDTNTFKSNGPDDIILDSTKDYIFENKEKNTNGITVEGSENINPEKSMNTTNINDYIINQEKIDFIFQLKGITEEEQVTKPLFTKEKKICPSCGKKFNSKYIYCPFDTTYLRKK